MPGNTKGGFGQENLSDVLIMDNLEKSLATAVYKVCGNSSWAIVEKFIKPRTSKIFGHPEYFMYGSGPSNSESGPYEMDAAD